MSPGRTQKDVISPLWQKIEDARIYMNEGKLPDARIFHAGP